jgi:hypothetical protein
MASARGVKLEKRALRELVKIGPDEHNPFGGESVSCSIEELVELMLAAEKNWESSVLKCASSKSLKSEYFEVSDLDLSNKGQLSLEDLVCFVNLYSNTFYRNRDLALVMRRLQLAEGRERGGIDYATFLDAFAA